MADVIPEEALVNLLEGALGDDKTVEVRAFKNVIVPSSTITLASFVEADFSGYAIHSLNPAVSPVESEDGMATTQQLNAVFTHNGGPVSCNVYGYYITQGFHEDMKLIDFKVDEDGPTLMANYADAYEATVTVLAVQET